MKPSRCRIVEYLAGVGVYWPAIITDVKGEVIRVTVFPPTGSTFGATVRFEPGGTEPGQSWRWPERIE